MKLKLLLISIFIFNIWLNCNSQKLNQWIDSNQKVPVEKIYIHTNSDIYFTGDTIFFKSYLTDCRSGLLIPKPENIYVSLFDAYGKPVVQTILLSKNGQVSGSLKLPGSTKPGNYILQAYTDFLLNFDSCAFFYKILTVSGLSGPNQPNLKPSIQANILKNLSFYPEGGILLENRLNLIAFKAINHTGSGVDVQGNVVDEQNKIVTTFKTDFDGLGLFFLTPEPGKKYFAKIPGLQSFKYEFIPLKDKTIIKLINHTRKEVIINILSNSEKNLKKPFYLVNMCRGEVVFYQEFILENSEQIIKFESKNLKQGINKLILLNEDLMPVSERMLFSAIKDINPITVTCNQVFKTKSRIDIRFEDADGIAEHEISNLSITVIPEHSIPQGGFETSFLSSIYLGSELRNYQGKLTEYFNNREISTDSKLRLLMFTIGADSYLWNIIHPATTPLPYKQKAGLDLKGTVKNLTTGIPMQNSDITLSFQQNNETAFLTQKSNNEGQFTFSGLIFSDTASIKVQAKNEKGNLNSDIQIQPFSKPINPPDTWLNHAANSAKIPDLLYKQRFNLHLLEKKSLARDQANNKQRISKNKSIKVKDDHYRLYDKADQVIDVAECGQSYDNIIDFITGKATGVDIYGDNIRIRGISSFSNENSPLFLIDGVPVVSYPDFQYPEESGINAEEQKLKTNLLALQSVKSIPINDVDKIEILRSPQNLAFFGVRGANGVIAIYTQRGKSNTSKQFAKGILEARLSGYNLNKKFYSPEYNNGILPEKLNDFRLNLYWNPDVKTTKGIADISFFSNDLTGKYKVLAEGITSGGKICVGSAEFEITR